MPYFKELITSTYLWRFHVEHLCDSSLCKSNKNVQDATETRPRVDDGLVNQQSLSLGNYNFPSWSSTWDEVVSKNYVLPNLRLLLPDWLIFRPCMCTYLHNEEVWIVDIQLDRSEEVLYSGGRGIAPIDKILVPSSNHNLV